MLVVSINGLNNVGKTTHIRLLQKILNDQCFAPNGIYSYDDGWNELPPQNRAKLWCRDCPTEKFTKLVFRSYFNQMQAVGCCKKHVVLIDQGIQMLEAVCIATAMLKDSIDYEVAKQKVEEISQKVACLSETVQESIKVLLVHSNEFQKSVNMAIEREKVFTDENFKQYQFLLLTALSEQKKKRPYDAIICCEGKSIVEIQNELRKLLNTQEIKIPFYCKQIKKVYAFCGLSESGKTISGEYLRIKYNVTRLKISYFLDTALRNNHTPKMYSESDETLAELLVNELDRFSRFQDYLEEISIESLHNRPEVTSFLKQLLGDKLVIIYLDSAVEIVQEKDGLETSRCAEQVRCLSDFVIGGDFDLFNLHTQLDTVYLKTSLREFTPNLLPIEKLNIPIQFKEVLNVALETFLEQFRDRAKLFAVVGSAGYQGVRNNWSDIDIFIIIEPESLMLVRNWFRVLQERASIKIGIATITPVELSIMLVEFKVANSLYMLKTGKLAAQFLNKNYKLPAISDNYRRAKNINNISSLIHTLRRELINNKPDIRHIFKLVLRVMRNLLQFGKNESANIDEIMHDFHVLYPEVAQIGFLNYQNIVEHKVNDEEVIRMGLQFVEWYEIRLFRAFNFNCRND